RGLHRQPAEQLFGLPAVEVNLVGLRVALDPDGPGAESGLGESFPGQAPGAAASLFDLGALLLCQVAMSAERGHRLDALGHEADRRGRARDGAQQPLEDVVLHLVAPPLASEMMRNVPLGHAATSADLLEAQVVQQREQLEQLLPEGEPVRHQISLHTVSAFQKTECAEGTKRDTYTRLFLPSDDA